MKRSLSLRPASRTTTGKQSFRRGNSNLRISGQPGQKKARIARFAGIAAGIAFGFTACLYGLALWYQHSQNGRAHQLGATFIPSYAEFLGLNPQQTFDALINDLSVRQFRLVSYWNQIETSPGVYDFTALDWQMKKAEDAGASVSLAIGLRQPRWPECHAPSWIDTARPARDWQPQLEKAMTAVVNRYKSSPALMSYQLENEYFLRGFGMCTNHDRGRLVSEYNLVKRLDPKHSIIVSRSNNALGWPAGRPSPDRSGISIYRRVWDAQFTRRYITYPIPSWYYSALLGWTKLVSGQDTIIHELQAEPWTPRGQTIPQTSLAEQNKSFDAARLHSTVSFAKDIGPRDIYLWGGEYWYYRKQVLHDPSVWQAAKTIFGENQAAPHPPR